MFKENCVLTLGKWTFKLGLVPLYYEKYGMMFHFGIFKVVKFPSEGKDFQKSDYKGFWVRKIFRGFEITL